MEPSLARAVIAVLALCQIFSPGCDSEPPPEVVPAESAGKAAATPMFS